MTPEQPETPGADPYFPPPPPPPGAPPPVTGYLPPAPPGYPPTRSRVQDTPRDGRPAYGTPPTPPTSGFAGYGTASSFGSLPEGAEYASWASRAGAALLDAVVVTLLLIPILVVFGIVDAVSPHPPPDPDGTEHASTAGTVVLLVCLFGQVCFWAWNCWRAGSRGQSLGKRWVGIHLVGDRSGRPPGGWVGLGRAVLRGLISGATLGLYGVITALWPLRDVRRQTLDDKLVNTVVVRFPGNRLPDQAPRGTAAPRV